MVGSSFREIWIIVLSIFVGLVMWCLVELVVCILHKHAWEHILNY